MKAYQVIVRGIDEMRGRSYIIYALSEQLACIGARVKQIHGECIQSMVDDYKERITKAYIESYHKQINTLTLETIPIYFIQEFFLDYDYCFVLMPEEITVSKSHLLT